MKFGKIVLAVILFAVVSATVFAQTGAAGAGRSGGGRYVLTVNSNVRGAQVFINAVLQKGVTPMDLTLGAGSYSITVRADGYRDYVANLNLTRNTTINATLEPITHALMITSNVRDSRVYVDGQGRGTAPTRLNLPRGNYSVTVEADNHYQFTTAVDLTRDVTVNAQLQAMTFRLNATSNVQGAEVFLGNQLLGRTPLQVQVTPGTYLLKVIAAGYSEFSQTIAVTDHFNINVNLRKQVSQVTFVVPSGYLNPAVKDPLRMFELYVDGSRVQGNLSAPFEVEPGEHLIRVQSGGFAFEGRYVFEAGRDYQLELGLGLLLKPAPVSGR